MPAVTETMIEVRRYTPDDQPQWDAFVERSRNATFLLRRGYMDYHAHRFDDHSLLVFRKGRLYALLPGNSSDDTFFSHQGLTYGGLVVDGKATADVVCDVFSAVNDHLRREGFSRVVYKPIPHIYHRQPSEEDVYALFLRCNARLLSRNVSSTIVLSRRMPLAESRRSGLRKALAAGVTMAESRRLQDFWPILEANLQRRYAARPVHTLAEMELLMQRFPQNIRLFMASTPGGTPLAGTVVYLSSGVVHTQYISATPEGRTLGALDLLFDRLLSMPWTQAYFDFGTSASGHSCEVCHPLLFQKLGFGGRAVCYDTYSYPL